MMLHRHFEEDNKKDAMTRLPDVTADVEPSFDPDDRSDAEEKETPRRGRPRKAD